MRGPGAVAALRGFAAVVALVMTASLGHAQARPPAVPDTADPLARAMWAEDRHELKIAAAAYRQVLQRALSPGVNDGDQADMALLGLERVWAEAGVRDSMLPVVQRVLMLRRADPVARAIQLRTLIASGQDDAARIAFTDWRRAVPAEAAPYREYSRLLLTAGRARAADSVLTEAARLLGSARDLSGEVAQLNVALERWQPAAVAYRTAVIEMPWMETAALFALQRVPAAVRDTVRQVLSAPPVVLGPRRLLANLEMAWGEPRRAWSALSAVKLDDSTVAAWRAFGEQAESSDAWLVARDAWVAVFEKRGDLESAQRGAQAALQGGDAAGALALATRGRANRTGPVIAKTLLPVEVAALGELGRPVDARKAIDDNKQYLDEGSRNALLKPLVGAWLRAGDLEQARAAAQNADLLDDDETAGWLALYEGDLATARKRLSRVDARRGSQIEALSVLARTRAASSPPLGAAFLSLAKRDTTLAVREFIALADSAGDAAPALLATAARLEEARKNDEAAARALVLWKRIRTTYPKSAEAPEAALAWAQLLVRSGDAKGAAAQLEAMLVDYADSAMAPQARRELERLRGQIPPDDS